MTADVMKSSSFADVVYDFVKVCFFFILPRNVHTYLSWCDEQFYYGCICHLSRLKWSVMGN